MSLLRAIACFLLLQVAFLPKGTAQALLDQEIFVPPGTYKLEQVFELFNDSGVTVAYSPEKLPGSSWSNTSQKGTIRSYLEDIKATTGIEFKTTGDIVVISYEPKKPSDKKVSIRGFLRDAETGESLIGATVYMPGTNKGTVSNKYGYYSFTLKEGSHIIRAAFLGYNELEDTLIIKNKNKFVNFMLTPKTEQLSEIVVSAVEPDENITSLIPSRNTINLNTKGQIPYFLGEVDVLQGATLLPGISTLGEDANGLNIRGGTVDQNLILLDEATVYNPNHLFGLISIFNPETVNSLEIMKGFIPPSYGGRSSSVINVHQREGNDQNFKFTGGIGFLSARFIAEGPLKRNKSSFIASARQSLLNISLDENITSASFRDLNFKVNLKANKENTFFLSAYYGRDVNENQFNRVNRWGNRNISARWNHLFGPRIFTNFSAIISEYNYQVSQPQEAGSYIGKSRILDYTLKSDWGFVISSKHELGFGGSMILHRLKPGDRIPFEENSSSSNPLFLDSEHGLESAVYVSHQAKINKQIFALYGLRISSLQNFGPGKIYQYEEGIPKSNNSIIDTVVFNQRTIMHSSFGFEPRASFVFQLSKDKSIKTSYSRTFQYLHLISNTISPSPTDTWKLADTYIPPTSSDHFSLGYYQNFINNRWEAYVEMYYKSLANLVEYKNGADLLYNEHLETELLRGAGRSYGTEFFLKKNKGNFTGWLSYTLSKSEVKVVGSLSEENVNSGKFFPANHDKLHDISIVGIYEILPRLSGSFSFNFHSGIPFTLPAGKYEFEGITVPHFKDRNQSRLPDYHRLDFSLKWQGKKIKKSGEPKKINDYWTLSVYNAYGRNNVYSYFIQENPINNTTEIIPNTIFDRPIPAITYHFKF